MTSNRGFLLVELMIAIAILSVLAAIAVPMVREAQLRARRAEVPTVLAGLDQAQMAYLQAMDAFAPGSAHPTSAPGNSARPWLPGSAPGFDEIGFVPDGNVYGQYLMRYIASGGQQLFEIQGTSELDLVFPPYAQRWTTPDAAPGEWSRNEVCFMNPCF